jgi:hypothetical protein
MVATLKILIGGLPDAKGGASERKREFPNPLDIGRDMG